MRQSTEIAGTGWAWRPCTVLVVGFEQKPTENKAEEEGASPPPAPPDGTTVFLAPGTQCGALCSHEPGLIPWEHATRRMWRSSVISDTV